jgi:zinc finger SWIM domain-containing protein 3
LSTNLSFDGITSQDFRNAQAFEIEVADDSKSAHELASRQFGGTINLSYTYCDHKNHLQRSR